MSQISPPTRSLATRLVDLATTIEYVAANGNATVLDACTETAKLHDALAEFVMSLVKDGAAFKIPATKMSAELGIPVTLVREAVKS